MAQYICRVMADNGRILEEEFTAASQTELLTAFGNRGLRPISITEVKASAGGLEFGSKKLNNKGLVLFCRQMSTLLHSGVPLVKCYDIIASQSDDKKLKKAMKALETDVETGLQMSAAMQRQGEVFPEMLIRMTEVGEVTGDLNNIMERMANQYESSSRISRKVKGAMTYPIVLIFVALAAVVFMLIAVIPGFVEVFESLNSELPVLTRALLAVSDFITTRWYVLVLAVPIVVLAVIRVFRQPQVIRLVDQTLLAIPMLKGPMQKILSARFTRTLYTLVSSGVPIVQALDQTNKSIRNTVLNEALEGIILGVQQGKGISVQLAEYPVFPKLLVSMINIGESSGQLEDMLSKTADYYDEELDAAISQLTSILEPVMILFVGLLIGIIVLALYSPMFGMISAVQNAV